MLDQEQKDRRGVKYARFIKQFMLENKALDWTNEQAIDDALILAGVKPLPPDSICEFGRQCNYRQDGRCPKGEFPEKQISLKFDCQLDRNNPFAYLSPIGLELQLYESALSGNYMHICLVLAKMNKPGGNLRGSYDSLPVEIRNLILAIGALVHHCLEQEGLAPLKAGSDQVGEAPANGFEAGRTQQDLENSTDQTDQHNDSLIAGKAEASMAPRVDDVTRPNRKAIVSELMKKHADIPIINQRLHLVAKEMGETFEAVKGVHYRGIKRMNRQRTGKTINEPPEPIINRPPNQSF